MSDTQKTSDEDILARQLEELHQVILDSDGNIRDVPRADSGDAETAASQPMIDDELQSAKELLQLMERVRRGLSESSAAGQSQISTHDTHSVTPPADPDNPTTAFTAGRRIGRFEIIRQVGRGGFGYVFLARDPRLDRFVALKIPRPDSGMSTEMQERFIREGKTAAALSHPNIVQVYEAGSAGDVPYIASQYIEGMTLGKWRKKHPRRMDFRQAAKMVAMLAEAVQHAHLRGVLHRDLKPGNILLELNSDAAIAGDLAAAAKISDFGLAKFTFDQSQETVTGAIIGTPSYMPPEQTAGWREEIGPQADVYGLGAILFELLTGQQVFQGDSVGQLIDAVQNQAPRPPREIEPEIPRDLEAICLKCLEKSPADRYQSAHQLHLDLTRFLDGLPVLARPSSALERIKLWGRRNPALAAASIAASLFLLAALIATSVGLVSTSAALNRERAAKAAAKRAQGEAEKRYLQTKQAVDTYFTQVSENRLLSVPGMRPLRHQLLQTALTYYQGFVAEQPDDQSLVTEMENAHFRIAKILSDLGRPTEAVQHFNQALVLQDEQRLNSGESRSIDVRQGETLRHISQLELELGQPNQALQAIEKAIAVLTSVTEQFPDDFANHYQLALSLNTNGVILKETGKPQEAKVRFERSIASLLLLNQVQPDNQKHLRQLAKSRGNLANVNRMLGNLSVAEELLDDVIVNCRRLAELNAGSPQDKHALAKALANRAILDVIRKENRSASTLLVEAVKLFDELALRHPDFAEYVDDAANAHNLMGVSLIGLNAIAQAEKEFRKSTEQYAARLALDSENAGAKSAVAIAHLNFGAFLADNTDRLEEARENLLEGLRLTSLLVAENPDNLNMNICRAACHLNLANLMADQTQLSGGMEHADQAVDQLTGLIGQHPRHAQIARYYPQALASRARIFEELGEFSKAIADWQSVIENSPPPDLPYFRTCKGICLARQGDVTAALEAAEHAATLRLDSKTKFELARLHAILVDHSSSSDDEAVQQSATELLGKALNWLRQAKDAGYFSTELRLQKLTDGSDFEALRDDKRYLDVVAEISIADADQ